MSTAVQVQGPKAIELREEHLALAPVMDMKEAKKALDELAKFVKEQLVEGTGPDADYGRIPGTNKPSLYQPGAQKIAFYFGLTPVPKLEREIMTAEFCSKTYTVTMVDRRSGREVAACSGSCNSAESRFFKRGKAVYVDARETENTCDKMAQKRALVGATIIATRAAGLFTQDVEDLPKAALGQDAESEEEERDDRPRKERPRAAMETVETLEQAIAFPLPWKSSPLADTPLGQLRNDLLWSAVEWCEKKKQEAGERGVSRSLENLYAAAHLILAARETGELEEPPATPKPEDPAQAKLFEERSAEGEQGPDPTKMPAASSSTGTASATPSTPPSSGAAPSTSAPAGPAKQAIPGEPREGEQRSNPSEAASPSFAPAARAAAVASSGSPTPTPDEGRTEARPRTTGRKALEALDAVDPAAASVYALGSAIRDAIALGPFTHDERTNLRSLFASAGMSPKKLAAVRASVLKIATEVPF